MRTELRIAAAWVAARTIERMIAKAFGVSEVAQIARLEKKARELLLHQWEMLIPAATQAAVNAIEQGKSSSQVEAAVAKIMQTWREAVSKAYLAILEDAYYLAREAGWKKAVTRQGSLSYDGTAKAAADVPTIGIGDVVDRGAVTALQAKEKFWMGNLMRSGWTGEIRNIATKAIESGRGPGYHGKELESKIKEALGTVSFPGGYKGSAETYFDGVTANAMTVARSQGQLRSFTDLGIASFQIVNPDDDRTCPVCGALNGKVFQTSMGTEQMSREIAAKDKERVKEVHPWISLPQIQALTIGPGNTGQKEEALAKAGVVMPPYHFKCRCTIDATIEAGSWIPPVDVPPEPKEPPPSIPIKEPAKEPAKPVLPKEPKPRPPKITVTTPEGPVSTIPKTPMPGLTAPNWNTNDKVAPGSFDAGELLSNLKIIDDNNFNKAGQAAVRKQLNSLSVKHGLQPSDLVLNKTQRAKFEISLLQADVAGQHALESGVLRTNEQTLRGAIKFLEQVQAGKTPPLGPLSIFGDGDGIQHMKVLVHEQMHGSVNSKDIKGLYRLGVTGKKECTAIGKVFHSLEETGAESATWKVMSREFGYDFQDLRSRLGVYRTEITNLQNQVMRPAAKSATGLNIGSNEMDEILSNAGLAFRANTTRIRTIDQYTDKFLEGMELPTRITSKMSNSEKEIATVKFRREFKKELYANPDKLWPKEKTLTGQIPYKAPKTTKPRVTPVVTEPKPPMVKPPEIPKPKPVTIEPETKPVVIPKPVEIPKPKNPTVVPPKAPEEPQIPKPELNNLKVKQTSAGAIIAQQRRIEAAIFKGQLGAKELKEKVARGLANELKDNSDFVEMVRQRIEYSSEMWDRLTDEGKRKFIEKEVSLMVKDWANSSHAFNAMVVQLAARDELGMANSTMKHWNEYALGKAKEKYEKNEKAYRAFVRAQYERTQKWLKANGIDELFLMRGQNYKSIPDEIVNLDWTGGAAKKISIEEQPISSWTTSPEIAERFTRGVGSKSTIIGTSVPASRIFSMPRTGFGCANENEFVVLGGKDEVVALAMPKRFMLTRDLLDKLSAATKGK